LSHYIADPRNPEQTQAPSGKHLRDKVATLSSYVARVGCVLRAPLRIVAAAKGAKHEADEPLPTWYPEQFKELMDGCEEHFACEINNWIGMMHEMRSEGQSMGRRSMTRDIEVNEAFLRCSTASIAWSAVNSQVLRNLRGQPDHSRDARGGKFDPMNSSARGIVLHGWKSHPCEYDMMENDDMKAVDDPSMFRSDAKELAVSVNSDSEDPDDYSDEDDSE
jgi:hypothetical protein